MAKQTKITIETDTLLLLRGRTSIHVAWCERCAAETDMIALETFAVISNMTPGAVEEWINSQELHRLQAADGAQLICLNSLLGFVQKRKIS